jgi:hypothetical protein
MGTSLESIEAATRAGNPTAGERLREIVAARRDQAGDYARRDGLRAGNEQDALAGA